MSLVYWGGLDTSDDFALAGAFIDVMVDERARQEEVRAAEHLEHINRSLGQRFRRLREELQSLRGE